MKTDFTKAMQSKNIRDYTYAIMFFFVASFFAIFVIRPVLSIAISIRREGDDLRRVNRVYEDNIDRVLELQAQIEEVRSRQYLLDEALPHQPQIQEIITDIDLAAKQSGVTITSVQVDPLVLKESDDPKNQSRLAKKVAAERKKSGDEEALVYSSPVGAQINVQTSFDGAGAFLQALVNQRRIKRIDSATMNVVKSGEGEETIQLNVQFELEGYYLADSQ